MRPDSIGAGLQMNKILMGAAMGALVSASAGAAAAAGTNYTYTPTGDIGAGAYGVETTPVTQRPDLAWGSYAAPTGAPASFEVINAATTADTKFWYDTFSLTAGTTYDVTAVVANNYAVSAPVIDLYVGNTAQGTPVTLASSAADIGTNYNNAAVAGPWRTITFAYTPTTSGLSTLGLVDTNLAGAGNDFSLSSVQVTGGGTVISAAPEPAAWALLMLAVGMIGSSLRLRRRRSVAAA